MTASRLRGIARMWSAPGARYDEFARELAVAADDVLARLELPAGARVADVACGTGLAARRLALARAAREGRPTAAFDGGGEPPRGRAVARIVGVDIAPGLIAAARALSRGLPIDYCIGDAEALPLADAAVDAAVSTFGVSFAADPARAAAELARVVRPGGRLGLATWLDDEPSRRLAAIFAEHVSGARRAPPPGPWGAPERVEALLRGAWSLALDHGVAPFFAATPEDACDRVTAQYGPMCAVWRGLPPDRRDRLRRDLVGFYRELATAGGVVVPRRYLVVTGARLA